MVGADKRLIVMLIPDDAISPLTLSRAVDGALSREELTQLLHICDQVPTRWKQVALAFFEEQALKNDLMALRLEGSLLHSDVSPAVQPSVRTSVSEVNPPLVSRRPMLRLMRQTAIAISLVAGLLLAFWLGREVAIKQTSPSTGSAPSLLSKNHPEQPTITAPAPPPSASEMNKYPQVAGNMVLELTSASGQSEQFTVPVVYATPAQQRQRAESSTALPVEWEAQIRETGYSISKRRDLLPVTLNNGATAVIPVAQYQLHQPTVE